MKKRGGKIPKFIRKFPNLISKRKQSILKAVARNGQMNIKQVSLNLKISYKETYKNINQLTSLGLLKRKKLSKQSGHPVIVSLPNFNGL